VLTRTLAIAQGQATSKQLILSQKDVRLDRSASRPEEKSAGGIIIPDTTKEYFRRPEVTADGGP
jgi:hypothetical protein